MSSFDQSGDRESAGAAGAHGGAGEAGFGLRHLMRAHQLGRDQALSQMAPGPNDYGVDGFHFDGRRRNLYLYQFNPSDAHTRFNESLPRLIHPGMERIFGAAQPAARWDDLMQQIQSCLIENARVIDCVIVRLVLRGNAAAAAGSQVLGKLREDLESRRHLIDHRLGRSVVLAIEIVSAAGGRVINPPQPGHEYPVALAEKVSHQGPGGERMTVGFMPLTDLRNMYLAMGQRFFERNIRYALSEEEAVNRSIHRSLERAVLENSEDPSDFAFNHNGVTLSAERVAFVDGRALIVEPRLLNGAQTITTFDRFVRSIEARAGFAGLQDALQRLRVMGRLITGARQEFVTTVTINNNRQNPVDPANLHANDLIQLEIEDRLRDTLGIFYERQERAFANLSEEDRGEVLEKSRPVELVRPARTFVVSDGDIDRLSRFREVFEDEALYGGVFCAQRLEADLRHVILCYKVQFRLSHLVREVVDKGVNKYAFLSRARNLLWALMCQAILNAPDLEERADRHGRALAPDREFNDWLSSLVSPMCRFILKDLVEDRQYADRVAEGNFGFLRSNAACRRAMQIAHRQHRWTQKVLGRPA